jgi:hypothetical protein
MSEASHHLSDGLAVFHNDKGRWGRRMDEATCCRVPLNLDFNFGVKLCWLPHKFSPPGAVLCCGTQSHVSLSPGSSGFVPNDTSELLFCTLKFLELHSLITALFREESYMDPCFRTLFHPAVMLVQCLLLTL